MRRLLLAGFLVVAPLTLSCGGSSTSPSAAPVTTPAPSTASGPTSLNMALRSHLDLAALGVTAGSGCWGYTSPGGRRFALVGTSAGLSVVDVTNPAAARVTGRDRGRLERVARGEDLPPARLRDHRGADRPRHRRPARPRPADEGPHLERHLRLRALAVDRRGARAALRARDAERHARARPDRPIPRTRARSGASPTSTSTTATGAATVLYAAAIRNGFLATLDVTRSRRDPRDQPLHHRRQLHPQRVADARRPLHLHDRRAGRAAARGLGPPASPRPAQGVASTSRRPARSPTT